MRGSTKKKIEKFVDLLIEQTPKEELLKTRSQMLEEVKAFWKREGQQGKKFVHKAVEGTLTENDIPEK